MAAFPFWSKILVDFQNDTASKAKGHSYTWPSVQLLGFRNDITWKIYAMWTMSKISGDPDSQVTMFANPIVSFIWQVAKSLYLSAS